MNMKQFKDLGGKVVENDKLRTASGRLIPVVSPTCVNSSFDVVDHPIVEFAWRAMETLPDTVRFLIEYNEQGTAWRPLLDQSAPTKQDLTKLDVKFDELDRDTQLRLVNHVLDGGEYEHNGSHGSDLKDPPDCTRYLSSLTVNTAP